jgi:hypothetical protein
MPSQQIHRSDQKLRYARIQIEELGTYLKAGSNDEWENSHQESVFYHLVGSAESLLHEINKGYSLGLDLKQVKMSVIECALSKNGQSSPAFDHWKALREDVSSWLSLLFRWRNHGTHRQRVSKKVSAATGGRHVDNTFKDPCSGKEPAVYRGLGCQAVLEALASEVQELILNCRRLDPSL